MIRWVAAVLALLLGATSLAAQSRTASDRYDPTFRKYSKRFFGPAYDWRLFKAQGMAESDLTPTARSRVGARGIMQLMPYDRHLWDAWKEQDTRDDRRNFMFGSYNAGRGTILRAQRTARERQLDHLSWLSVESVAGDVPRWRYRETLGYVRKIRESMARMDEKGHVTDGGKRKAVQKESLIDQHT